FFILLGIHLTLVLIFKFTQFFQDRHPTRRNIL
ncbi:hypothetical protein DBR06_SOUSAS4410098, partial [Sousa chinensis]